MRIKTKDCIDNIAVKGLDFKNRVIEGYGSVFNFEDSDKDVLLPGSFRKTINESGPGGKDRIAHLYQHDMKQPLGKFSELYEDDKGLVFVSKLPETALANDVLKLYEARILREHSIGFSLIKGSYNEDEKDSPYYISEVRLWEISTVTLGANSQALVKSMDKIERIEWLRSEMKSLTSAIRNGSFTDSTFELLAAKLEDYTQEYDNIINSLTKQLEPGTPTPEQVEPDELSNQIKSLAEKFTLQATTLINI